jgi:DNA-directed RNA polymerase subunit RPC12/RpoP
LEIPLPPAMNSAEIPSLIFPDGEDTLCAICHDLITVGHEYKELPCGHQFHSEEIDDWLYLKANCPTCRHRLA